MIAFGSGLQLGLPEIDDQHQEMVELINHIYAEAIDAQSAHSDNPAGPAEAQDEGCRRVKALLGRLVRSTESHFSAEERLMRDASYPDTVDHQYEHKMLMVELKVFVRSVCSGEESLKVEDLDSLKQWLVGHIVMEDRQLVEYLTLCPLPLAQVLPAQAARYYR
jgi:hemerythrin